MLRSLCCCVVLSPHMHTCSHRQSPLSHTPPFLPPHPVSSSPFYPNAQSKVGFPNFILPRCAQACRHSCYFFDIPPHPSPPSQHQQRTATDNLSPSTRSNCVEEDTCKIALQRRERERERRNNTNKSRGREPASQKNKREKITLWCNIYIYTDIQFCNIQLYFVIHSFLFFLSFLFSFFLFLASFLPSPSPCTHLSFSFFLSFFSCCRAHKKKATSFLSVERVKWFCWTSCPFAHFTSYTFLSFASSLLRLLLPAFRLLLLCPTLMQNSTPKKNIKNTPTCTQFSPPTSFHLPPMTARADHHNPHPSLFLRRLSLPVFAQKDTTHGGEGGALLVSHPYPSPSHFLPPPPPPALILPHPPPARLARPPARPLFYIYLYLLIYIHPRKQRMRKNTQKQKQKEKKRTLLHISLDATA